MYHHYISKKHNRKKFKKIKNRQVIKLCLCARQIDANKENNKFEQRGKKFTFALETK